MTIKELASELNESIVKVYAFLEFQKYEFQKSEDFMLNDDICVKARQSKENSIRKSENEVEDSQLDNVFIQLPEKEEDFLENSGEIEEILKVGKKNFANEENRFAEFKLQMQLYC